MTAVVFRARQAPPPHAGDGAARGAALIGFQDQGNLGMGYLASTLMEAGHPVEVIEFRDPAHAIIERIRAANPLVVGLSLIFQYYLPDYRRLLQELRAAGITAHFTMGGHYPTLCPDEVLAATPELDSVARFEGEHTLLDLVNTLGRGQDWRLVAGLAYWGPDGMVETAARALVEDLDELPLPHRPYAPERVLGWPTMPLLGSRGCARRCSFCSIHTFYRGAPGRTVRVRAASKIADEMELLADERGVRIFLFQDDDFPIWGRAGKRWVRELVDEIRRRRLSEHCLWKISCRAEYIEPELFGMLRDGGLYLVYLGLESGSSEGLEVLNKQMTVETNLRAVDTLKELGMLVEYGFMLFDPSSTFESVRQNTQFLRTILADGSGGAVFCRMLPYGGTPIRDRLREEGRLRGDVRQPDYDFLDLRLNRYHELLNRAVAPWIHGEGLSHQLNWAWHEVFIMERLVGPLAGLDAYKELLAAQCRRSNDVLLDFVDETAVAFERGDELPLVDDRLVGPRAALGDELLALRNGFVARHQDELLGAVAASETVRGPILAPQLF